MGGRRGRQERGLEEASVRGRNECQGKLVDTEKGVWEPLWIRPGFSSPFFFFSSSLMKSGYGEKLFKQFNSGLIKKRLKALFYLPLIGDALMRNS